MNHDLLHYYERELAWFRQAGTDFAATNPTVAGNLNLRDDVVEDPHVSRLIESVALLNARIQQRLDDDFPQISDTLLEHLHPQFLAPLPAMTVVEMIADDIEKPLTIDAHSLICSAPVDGISCQFRTVYPVTLLPLQLHSAQLLPQPLTTPAANAARDATAVLVLRLQANSDDFSFAASDIDKLRLFLRGAQYNWPLHQLLTDHCVHIAVASDAQDQAPVAIAPANLRVAGFAAEEALLPSLRPAPQPCHHLLEFLHFPQKFLFIDLHGLATATTHMRGNISLFIYLDASDRELERNLDANFFSLTATPVVNLFDHAAEPISLSPGNVEYPLVADARNSDGYEVHTITQMVYIDDVSGERSPMAPFFGITHANCNTTQYWHHRRELAHRDSQGGAVGFDSFVMFSDIACNTMPPQQAIVQPSLLCSNRNLPARLVISQTEFRLRNDSGRVQRIRALLPLSKPIRRQPGTGARWRLLSHMSGSLCGLADSGDATAALREILHLHAAEDNAVTRALIAAIDDVKIDTVMLPLRCQGRIALCRGVDVCICINDNRLAGTSLTLYAMVLEHFLAQSVSLNSFIRLGVTRKGQPDIIKRWPPRAGTRSLL
jgi:type VI secretion system protein ImpG